MIQSNLHLFPPGMMIAMMVSFTLWFFNMAMENHYFLSFVSYCSIAMLSNLHDLHVLSCFIPVMMIPTIPEGDGSRGEIIHLLFFPQTVCPH